MSQAADFLCNLADYYFLEFLSPTPMLVNMVNRLPFLSAYICGNNTFCTTLKIQDNRRWTFGELSNV